MFNRINMGKIDYYNIGKKNCKVVINITLEDKEKYCDTEHTPKWCYSCSASVYNHIGTDILIGGQCLDSLVPYFKDNELFNTLYRLWKNYHLNDLHAGTIAQEKAIDEWKNQGNKYEYTAVCNYLDSIGLLVDNGYRYGTGWLYRPIPKDDLKLIENLLTR